MMVSEHFDSLGNRRQSAIMRAITLPPDTNLWRRCTPEVLACQALRRGGVPPRPQRETYGARGTRLAPTGPSGPVRLGGEPPTRRHPLDDAGHRRGLADRRVVHSSR